MFWRQAEWSKLIPNDGAFFIHLFFFFLHEVFDLIINSLLMWPCLFTCVKHKFSEVCRGASKWEEEEQKLRFLESRKPDEDGFHMSIRFLSRSIFGKEQIHSGRLLAFLGGFSSAFKNVALAIKWSRHLSTCCLSQMLVHALITSLLCRTWEQTA